MSPSSTLRVGVVGIGFGQGVLIPAFRSDAACEVVAIAASSEERARRVADQLAVATAVGDWRALVDDPRIDAVAIAVPPTLQPEIAIAAANAGKHVFCEKPLALTVVDARAMRDAAEGNVVHTVDFEFPELPAWREFKAALAGRVGEIARVYVDMRVRGRRTGGDGRAAWKARDADGGGLWGGFLPHALYHLEWAAGPLRRLRARRLRDDRALHVWADYASGASAAVTLDAGAAFGSGHRVEVAGSVGTAILENPNVDHAGPFTLSIDGALVHADVANISGGDGRVSAVAPLARRFLEAIRQGGRTAPDLSDGLRVQQLLEAVDHAARDDAWVSV